MAETMDPAAYAAQCLERMTRTLGITTHVDGSSDQGRILLKVKAEDAGRLIGRGGRILNHFDYLLNRILSSKHEDAGRVRIEVEGAAERAPDERGTPRNPDTRPRRAADGESGGARGKLDVERLEKLALDAAKEVKRWGEPKTIGPFSAGERKVIHSTLQDDEGLQTESGEELAGRRKKITVRMAG